MKESLLSLIWHHIFGYKYYGVLTARKGTTEAVQFGGVWNTRKEAEQAMFRTTASFIPVEVYSFRSRHPIYNLQFQNAHLEEDGTLIFD